MKSTSLLWDLKGKANKCFNDIDLENIFKNFLWEKKRVIDFFDNFLNFSLK